MARNEEMGRWGEQLAALCMQRKGYTLVEKNYRSRFGEIDLIVQNERYLVFVEVKLRKNRAYAQAMEYVTPAKQQRLKTTALCYLAAHETALQPRFDVVEVYAPQGLATKLPRLRHVENAFS